MARSCTTPRPKSAATTSQAILEAARGRFLQESYESVGLRDIAGDARVDVALVSRYFGNKEELFRNVLGMGDKEDILPSGMADAEIPAFLASLFFEEEGQEGTEHLERLLIILRSASSPVASQIVRETLKGDVLKPLAGRLDGEQSEVRASLSMAVWLGMTILRTVLTVEPLCQRDCDLEERLKRLFEVALIDKDPA